MSPREVASLLNTREGELAVRARLYRLLADRPEYMRVGLDIRERIEKTSPPIRATRLPLVEALAVEDVTEVDRVCAAAVRRLRKGASADVLDLLGYLEPDRLAAVVLALPENRRRAVVNRSYEAAYADARIDEERVRRSRSRSRTPKRYRGRSTSVSARSGSMASGLRGSCGSTTRASRTS